MRTPRTFTIFRTINDSPDSVSQARFVAVELSQDECRRALITFGQLMERGRHLKAAGPSEPERAWWPDDPPQGVKAQLVRIIMSAEMESTDRVECLRQLATGWMYFTSLPVALRTQLRETATAPRLPSHVKPVTGFSETWTGFFRFLQGVGVAVFRLPGRDRGGDYGGASYGADDILGVETLLMSDGVSFWDVDRPQMPWDLV